MGNYCKLICDDCHRTALLFSVRGLQDGAILYYNKDLFDDAGIDYPTDDWTWDDLEAAALAMTKDVDGEHQYGFGMATNNTIQMWPIMIWAGGGDFIVDGASVFNK